MHILLALMLAGEPVVWTKMSDPDPTFVAPKTKARPAPRAKAKQASPEEELMGLLIRAGIEEAKQRAQRDLERSQQQVRNSERAVLAAEAEDSDAPQR